MRGRPGLPGIQRCGYEVREMQISFQQVHRYLEYTQDPYISNQLQRTEYAVQDVVRIARNPRPLPPPRPRPSPRPIPPHPQPRPSPRPRPVPRPLPMITCSAKPLMHNRLYTGSGRTRVQAESNALNACYSHHRNCGIISCSR